MKKELTLSLISVLGLLAVSLCVRQVLTGPATGLAVFGYLAPLTVATALLVALLTLCLRRTIGSRN